MKSEFVAEIEGEYGPVTIGEHLVQKIWARGEFRQAKLTTIEGRSLEIVNLGTWNRLDGPDFKNVSLRIDGELVNGDAEMHFFDSDWEAHGHESDPAFQNVVLHILVFPPKQRRKPLVCSIEHSLLFLDLLPQGLESYAEEEVLGALTAGDESALEQTLLLHPVEERKTLLVEGARKRWLGKLKFARKRIDLLGWEEACHQTALEILGYRYNRAVMLFLAGDYSLSALRTGTYTVDQIFSSGEGRWKLSGSRPANHPKQRISQYLDWVSAQPRWPESLRVWSDCLEMPEGEGHITTDRRQLKLANAKRLLSRDVLSGCVGGTRIENLICDGFLPLLAADSEKDLFYHWYYWFPGDVPSALKQLFSRLGEGHARLGSACNGSYQGLIRSLLER